MTLRRLALGALLLAGASAIFAGQAPRPAGAEPASPAKALPYTPEQADSCVAAFATIMASYIKPELAKYSDSAAVAEFTAGVAHAFDIRNQKAPYFFGVRSGLGMIDRVEGMESMGYPVTHSNFVPALGQALSSSAMGFTTETADAFLRRFMNILFPAPEPLSPESQQAFLDAQKAREGVQVLPGGVLFEVITEGEGATPSPNDRVKVTYKGALADGTVFDQTDKPISLPVSGVVKGFSEGLQHMKVGGTYRIFIPADLGYGDKGASGVIPPGAALDFTVTLVGIDK